MNFLIEHKRAFITVMSILCGLAIAITALWKTKPQILRTAAAMIVSPLQGGASAVSGWIGDRLEYFRGLSSFQNENELLKAENAALRDENARFALAMEENAEYARLYEMDVRYSEYPKTGAEIIAKDPNGWVDAYTVNKGSKHGLKQYMAVLSGGGFFGSIAECGADTSTVVSLLDDRASVSAQCLRTGDQGFVKGDRELSAAGLCRMEYIDIDARVMVGDEVVTSPMSTVYPPGIIIGTVTEITDDANGLTKTAVILPAASFRQVSKVLIVLEKDGDTANVTDTGSPLLR